MAPEGAILIVVPERSERSYSAATFAIGLFGCVVQLA